MALLSPFQRGLSLRTAAWEPLLSSPRRLLAPWGSSPVLCLCSVVLEGRLAFWFLLCELYLRTFFFIGGSMAPSRLHPLSVVHFQSTLFQTKGQNLIVPVLSFFQYCCPVRPTQSSLALDSTSLVALPSSSVHSCACLRAPPTVHVPHVHVCVPRMCGAEGAQVSQLPELLAGWPSVTVHPHPLLVSGMVSWLLQVRGRISQAATKTESKAEVSPALLTGLFSI